MNIAQLTAHALSALTREQEEAYAFILESLSEWTDGMSPEDIQLAVEHIGRILDEAMMHQASVDHPSHMTLWPPSAPLWLKLYSSGVARCLSEGHVHFSRLRELSLDSEDLDKDLSHIHAYFPVLKSIHLNGTSRNLVHWLSQQDLPRLESLSLYADEMAEELMPTLLCSSWFKNLRSLTMKYGAVDPIKWPIMKKCTHLIALRTVPINHRSSLGEGEQCIIDFLKKFPSAEDIHITFPFAYSNLGQSLSPNQLPKLKRLSITTSESRTIKHMTLWHQLELLEIEHLNLAEDLFPYEKISSARALALRGCHLTSVDNIVRADLTLLISLDLEANSLIKDINKIKYARWWPNLIQIGLINTGINEETLINLLEAKGPLLQRVAVGGYMDQVSHVNRQEMGRRFNLIIGSNHVLMNARTLCDTTNLRSSAP
jgi:hypothetical protein